MANYTEARNWSSAFRNLWANESKSLDIREYELCLKEWRGAHESKTATNFVIAIAAFCAGLWAVWESEYFMAVLLLAAALSFDRKSSHHMLASELMGSQRLLAMLINKQAIEIEKLRSQLTDAVENQEDKDKQGA